MRGDSTQPIGVTWKVVTGGVRIPEFHLRNVREDHAWRDRVESAGSTPGQRAMLEEGGLALTPDWDKPVRTVLDHFQLHDVDAHRVLARLWPGARAAAYEPRVRRVVADDIFTDPVDASLRQVTPIARAVLLRLLRIDAGPRSTAPAHTLNCAQ